MKLRVSFIEYLNSVPLGWSFVHGPQQGAFEVLFDVPSQCARHLAGGDADVGLIPVIEYARIAGLRVLPGISIAARREVKSVLFLSRRPIQEVRRVAVDQSSRTSVALLRILLERFYRRPDVTYTREASSAPGLMERYDAALLIGNAALKAERESLLVYDLAREWNRFTGLPFVFAFWAVRSGVNLGPQADIFYQSKKQGLAEVNRIAEHYSQKLSLPAAEIMDYLLNHLDYDLDESHLQGLRSFFELAQSLGLISKAPAIRFYPLKQAAGSLR